MFVWFLPLLVVVLIVGISIYNVWFRGGASMTDPEHKHVFGPDGCWCGAKQSKPKEIYPGIEMTATSLPASTIPPPPWELQPPPGVSWLFHSTVAGTNHGDRQQVASACEVGDMLTLEAEPTNAADPNAIRVLRNGRQLGYLKRHVAAEIAREDWPVGGLVAAVTEMIEGDDGDESKPYFVVNILLGRHA
jgi:hypothetical protein